MSDSSRRIDEVVAKVVPDTRQLAPAHGLFWTAADLDVRLGDFQCYFNGHRTHAGPGGLRPEPYIQRTLTRRRAVRLASLKINLSSVAADALTVNPIDSPCVAKLQIDTAAVPDPLCVLEIHEHALRGFDHEVQAGSDGRIDAAVERDGGITIQCSRA